jgi:hypothetical protein
MDSQAETGEIKKEKIQKQLEEAKEQLSAHERQHLTLVRMRSMITLNHMIIES